MEGMDMKRVVVCVVNNWPYLHSLFAESFVSMISYAKEREAVTGIFADFRLVWGAYVDVMRNNCAAITEKGQYDYLIMLDADMVYPKDTIERLVKHDLPVVGGLYYWKIKKPYKNAPGFGYAPHVYKKLKPSMLNEYRQYAALDVSEKKGLLEVDGLGGGGLCIKREVLEKVGRPQFECTWESTEISGEDLDFCRKAKEEGFNVYCDLDLELGHLTQAVIDRGMQLNINDYLVQKGSQFTTSAGRTAAEDVKVTKGDINEIIHNINANKIAGKMKIVGGVKYAKVKNRKAAQ
jgi:hypothetical protein